MPELPDIVAYVEALERKIGGQVITGIRVKSPFVVRSFDPPISAAVGCRVIGLRRMGKRIAMELSGDLFIVNHLMIAGRFLWKPAGAPLTNRISLAAFDFDAGTLVLTEAGTQKRASIHLVKGAEGLREFDRGGLEVLDATLDQFAERLRSENHTLKRSLTDPRLFSGIGNAYSDEILHRARLSPVQLTRKIGDPDIAALFAATKQVLVEWTDRFREQYREGFPEKVTAFRPEMAVHGKFGEPCPVCGTPVQRIRYASNETNYCARCQTGGRLLADRALSRLLKQDWPKSIDEL
ncbi:MAG TPA: DNA-formamidopyrimidine glycosylase family protein [Gemmatimonadaceae bacterium]|nr:DNA-formamidopyrimidine glycosylase family protein [Gemmatimonadaceae bacterium]